MDLVRSEEIEDYDLLLEEVMYAHVPVIVASRYRQNRGHVVPQFTRVTVAYGFDAITGYLAMGFSFCSPEDEFDRQEGRVRAYARLSTSPYMVATGDESKIIGQVHDLVLDLLNMAHEYGIDIPGRPHTWCAVYPATAKELEIRRPEHWRVGARN